MALRDPRSAKTSRIAKKAGQSCISSILLSTASHGWVSWQGNFTDLSRNQLMRNLGTFSCKADILKLAELSNSCKQLSHIDHCLV